MDFFTPLSEPYRAGITVDCSAGGAQLDPYVSRKINRETFVLLGWGRAILLQLAHPLVAAGVADHSPFQRHPGEYFGRARRTVGAMLAMTFGTDEQASAAAARINAIHARINGTLRQPAAIFPAGTPYSARDPQLLCWVHATLLDSMLLAYRQFVGPLSREEEDRYCAEAAQSAPLLGIQESLVPTDARELEGYLQRMLASGQIDVTEAARSLSQGLLSPPLGPAGPLFRLARLTTVGLLPAVIREGYGFEWDERRERSFNRCVTWLRRARSVLPPIIREWPAARRNSEFRTRNSEFGIPNSKFRTPSSSAPYLDRERLGQLKGERSPSRETDLLAPRRQHDCGTGATAGGRPN
jgi:uncharacterized protein (DUF2236 family)